MNAQMILYAGVMLTAYMIGSFPSALIVSLHLVGKDIRELGDGNMGARNTTHVLGWKAGILVAGLDFFKGALVILLSKKAGLPLSLEFLAGILVVLGHDFPVFAHFRGGQGMAASLGTMSILTPRETLIGLILFGLVYLILRHFNVSAAIGLGTLVYLLWKHRQPFILIAYTVGLFLSIPLKKYWDWKHPFKKLALQG